MARKALTPQDRANNIGTAVRELPALVARANQLLGQYGPNDPRTLRAWECVEMHGATVHRQARLLAGKSRGG
jgi:hypothetical protein